MTEILSHISAVAAGALVAAVWQGLVLAAGVALCLRLLPGITAAARSVVWSAVMIAAVVLPFVHFGGSAGVANGRILHVDERLSVALVCVWAAMSLYRAAELMRSAMYLRGIASNASKVEVSAGLAALLQHQRPVALCVSEKIDRPSVVGFFAPKILLPVALLAKLSENELEQIVLHEMEHLRRRDDWTNLLQKMSLVVFPLNPVLVWVERRLCLERELACDDQVLRTTHARKAYAACLANLAEHSLVRRGVSLALGAWERQPELVKRVHRILSRSGREMGRRQVAAAVSMLLCGLMIGADGLAHSPELVCFGPASKTSGLAMSHVREIERPQLAGGHMVLAKAMMADRHEVYAVTATKHRRRHTSRTIRNVAQPFAGVRSLQTSWHGQQTAQTVLLVGWHSVGADGDMPILQSLGFSYAAVPVRNGWLVVQL